MLDWLFAALEWVSLLAGLLTLALGVAKQKPNNLSLVAIGAVQLGMLVQLVASIILVSSGQRARQDTIEFFAYVLVALIVPLGAAFWSLIERTRWSQFVLAVGALTVAVMVARMHQIWFG
jgi:uncharacterized membrane protein